MHPFEQPVYWSASDDAEYPFTAKVNGQTWVIRVNDWPEEATVFTLLVDNQELLHFDGWSKEWKRPVDS